MDLSAPDWVTETSYIRNLSFRTQRMSAVSPGEVTGLHPATLQQLGSSEVHPYRLHNLAPSSTEKVVARRPRGSTLGACLSGLKESELWHLGSLLYLDHKLVLCSNVPPHRLGGTRRCIRARLANCHQLQVQNCRPPQAASIHSGRPMPGYSLVNAWVACIGGLAFLTYVCVRGLPSIGDYCLSIRNHHHLFVTYDSLVTCGMPIQPNCDLHHHHHQISPWSI